MICHRYMGTRYVPDRIDFDQCTRLTISSVIMGGSAPESTVELRMGRIGSDLIRTEKNREPKWNRTEIQLRFGSVLGSIRFLTKNVKKAVTRFLVIRKTCTIARWNRLDETNRMVARSSFYER
jgi:hypothetical protein